jgi:hypothetical protein
MSTDSLLAHMNFMAEITPPSQLNIYRFLLTYGTLSPGAKRPKGFRKLANKMCYRNAQQLAVLHPDQYTYCEGIAQNIIATQHGWLVDKDGNVLDPTWGKPQDCAYFGVRIQHAYLTKFVSKHKVWTSLIGCYTHDNDLLTGAIPVDQALYL